MRIVSKDGKPYHVSNCGCPCECFIKEVGGHGPDWVNTVLEKYPNLDDPVYKEISKFVQSINL